MEIKVWKCDGCGKLLEKREDVYPLVLQSLPYKVCGEDETNEIPLHFCESCARNLIKTVRMLAGRLLGGENNASP